jgi:3D (Asp-Asp-Asp) domain-containing protein
MKLLFGRSAAFAAALLTISVFFYAKTSTAETRGTQQGRTQSQSHGPSPGTPGTDPLPLSRSPETPELAGPASATPLKLMEEPPPMASMGTRAGATPLPAQTFMATAYSLGGRTASGRHVGRGLIASDNSILPLGTRVRLEAGSYSGEYTVADAGGAVRGRRIDVWVPSTSEAFRFGRRSVKLSVLSYGPKRRARRR